MVQLKQDVEQNFQDNYTDTSIHFYGTHFDSSGLDSWAMLRFSPQSVTYNGSQKDCPITKGFVEVFTYAKTLKEATVLGESAYTAMALGEAFLFESEVVMSQDTFNNNTWFVLQRFNVTQI